MKISLGQHETAHFRSVDAWIEPNRPAYRGGAVRDNGFLCVAVQDGPQMRLESTSEDLWKLMDAVGVELGRKLWEELRRYKPYPRNGLAIEAAHPANRALAVYADLHENNLARIAALSAGDKDAAARHVEDGDELLGQYHRAEAVIGFAEPEEPQAQEPAAERDDDYDFAP